MSPTCCVCVSYVSPTRMSVPCIQELHLIPGQMAFLKLVYQSDWNATHCQQMYCQLRIIKIYEPSRGMSDMFKYAMQVLV